jgi:microfibrillar-associated protein 1
MAKPVFVPKHKRKLVQSEEKKWEEEEANLQRETERAEKRKMESRAIVAQQAAAVDASANDEDVDEEEGGATNAAPNADDDADREEARDAWEMRELERLLTAMDQQTQREMEQLEYQRRRQMTDAECLQEDIKTNRYQAPGSSRQGEPTGKGMQRFYHRGAYYMDEEEWDESDVRHKAAEYAKAATGEDKIDKSQLPEVMQVKNFGLARQNTKYKGLAKEDTTDKGFKMLPLVRKKKG